MGNHNTRPVISHEAVQILVEDAACSECVPRKIGYYPPPQWLPTSQTVWDSFMRDLQAQVKRLWTEGWFLILGILATGVVFILLSFPDGSDGKKGAFPFTGVLGIATIVAGTGGMLYLKTLNQRIDEDIEHVCMQYSRQLGVNIAYLRKWTGVCKPKHARIFRAVVVAPPGQPPVLATEAGAFTGGAHSFQPAMQEPHAQYSAPPHVQQMQPTQPQSDIPVAVAVPDNNK
uniref:Transmembrane protein n=1 Tax=Hemiselmis andersenii TaxID=464988 RepID=A0A6U4NWL6_HEMAN|mmetsp:Transcript_15809/g.36499  ORF Transcript_15809/g.36499 Transcript_15809/m.36499 type:complete len:230 (+) Transcript_15809:158-847(+)